MTNAAKFLAEVNALWDSDQTVTKHQAGKMIAALEVALEHIEEHIRMGPYLRFEYHPYQKAFETQQKIEDILE